MTCSYCYCHCPERQVVVYRGLPFCSVFHYQAYFRLNASAHRNPWVNP
jgi:hypothetical protein